MSAPFGHPAPAPLSRLRAAIRWARDADPAAAALFEGTAGYDRVLGTRARPVLFRPLVGCQGSVSARIIDRDGQPHLALTRTERQADGLFDTQSLRCPCPPALAPDASRKDAP